MIFLWMYSLHMFCERRASTKLFFAAKYLAFVRASPRMRAPMSGERACICKGLETFGTYKWTFTCVDIDVHRQSTALDKALFTPRKRTGIWPLLCMRTHMPLQVRAPRKGLGARRVRALVWPRRTEAVGFKKLCGKL